VIVTVDCWEEPTGEWMGGEPIGVFGSLTELPELRRFRRMLDDEQADGIQKLCKGNAGCALFLDRMLNTVSADEAMFKALLVGWAAFLVGGVTAVGENSLTTIEVHPEVGQAIQSMIRADIERVGMGVPPAWSRLMMDGEIRRWLLYWGGRLPRP